MDNHIQDNPFRPDYGMVDGDTFVRCNKARIKAEEHNAQLIAALTHVIHWAHGYYSQTGIRPTWMNECEAAIKKAA